MRTIKFQGIKYPIRELTVHRLIEKGVYASETITLLIGSEPLEDALFNAGTEESQEVDETIYFYLPDKEILTYTDEQLLKSIEDNEGGKFFKL